MTDYLGENTILSLISSLFSMCILFYFLRKSRKSTLTYSFLFYLLIVFLYPLDNVVHEFLISIGIYEISYHQLICRTLQYFSMSYIGAGWLIFCICFTVEKKRLFKFYTIVLLLLSTMLFIIESVRRQNINSLTVLYMEQFWFKTITTVIFILAGIFLLLKYRIKKYGFARKQATLLITAIAVPLISIMLQAYYKAQHSSLPVLFAERFCDLYLVPIGFTASCLIIAISTIKYRFLNLTRIASNKVYEKMKEAFIAIDINDTIINFNPAFYFIFSQITEVNKNKSADVFYKDLKSNALSALNKGNVDIIAEIQNVSETPVQGEISMMLQERKYYSVSIQPIFLNNNEFVGRTISFTEITSYKNLLLELNEKCNEGCNQLYAGVIYRICQEALTNSIRHGKARNISIVLRFSISMIKILIIDDGVGCSELHEGFGLSGMKQRIKELNGKIEYGSGGENGFSIFAEIPFENSKNAHKNGEESLCSEL